MRKLDAAHEAAVEKYRTARAPHEQAVKAWERTSAEADRANAELFKTCDDPVLLGRRAELANELGAADERIAQARDYHSRMLAEANQPETSRGVDNSPAIERARSRLPKAAQDVADALSHRDTLLKQTDELEDKMRSA
jgi:hypothetical protein